MGNAAARDSISVLPEDRALNIRIAEYGNTITGISYEIRNLSLDRLIERTQLENWGERRRKYPRGSPDTITPNAGRDVSSLPYSRYRGERYLLLHPNYVATHGTMPGIWWNWQIHLQERVWITSRRRI